MVPGNQAVDVILFASQHPAHAARLCDLPPLRAEPARLPEASRSSLVSVYLDDAAAQLEAEIRLAPEWPEEWRPGSDGRYHAEGWISACQHARLLQPR